MNKDEVEIYNRSEDRCSEPRGCIALVIRTDISRMPEIARLVEQVPGTKIVYQRTSVGRLRIVPEE